MERSFAWISHNRRMSRDYERLYATGEAFVYAEMTRLVVRRLARAQEWRVNPSRISRVPFFRSFPALATGSSRPG